MVITLFFAAIRGSVRVRTRTRVSDRVSSMAYIQFSKKYLPASVLEKQEGGYDL